MDISNNVGRCCQASARRPCHIAYGLKQESTPVSALRLTINTLIVISVFL